MGGGRGVEMDLSLLPLLRRGGGLPITERLGEKGIGGARQQLGGAPPVNLRGEGGGDSSFPPLPPKRRKESVFRFIWGFRPQDFDIERKKKIKAQARLDGVSEG